MRTRTENIVDDLRDGILCGAYPAGYHLQEAPLCEEMKVSRTPVRAALAALAAEGLLDYVPKRGYSVRGFSLDEIAATYDIRANLEGMACRLAAERGLHKDAALAIENTLSWGDGILAHGRLREEDRDQWMAMNNKFHQQLMDAAGNRMLTELIERTYRIPMVSSRVVHWYDFQAVKGSHDLHHRIYHYVRKGQGVNAEAAMREHVLQAIDQIKDRLQPTDENANVVVLNAYPHLAGARNAG
jgi:GntR family transcriptional regulator of vanillate catabolism